MTLTQIENILEQEPEPVHAPCSRCHYRGRLRKVCGRLPWLPMEKWCDVCLRYVRDEKKKIKHREAELCQK